MNSTPIANDDENIEHLQFLGQVNKLRHTDNVTNWYYLAREYLFLSLVIGATIMLLESMWVDEGSAFWAVPLVVAAILCVGAGQHRLASLGHEAAHYLLFRDRLLNELASEWFCMFPIFATTHYYRLQHFGHHKHTNDSERDPDLIQLRLSGHAYPFPMTLLQFLWKCILVQILWPPNLVRYVLVRSAFYFRNGCKSLRVKRQTSAWLKLTVVVYHCVLCTILISGAWNGEESILFGFPVIVLGLMATFLIWVPSTWFCEYSLKSALSERLRCLLRLLFNSLVLCGLAICTYVTGVPGWLYFILFWLVPAGTSLAFFMMLGQVSQHGCADQGYITNTRVFLVHSLIRWTLFPIGNDYHVPHHMFMNVPHYNLPQLHALLMQMESYRHSVTVLGGYFLRDPQNSRLPSFIDLVTKPAQSSTDTTDDE